MYYCSSVTVFKLSSFVRPISCLMLSQYSNWSSILSCFFSFFNHLHLHICECYLLPEGWGCTSFLESLYYLRSFWVNSIWLHLVLDNNRDNNKLLIVFHFEIINLRCQCLSTMLQMHLDFRFFQYRDILLGWKWISSLLFTTKSLIKANMLDNSISFYWMWMIVTLFTFEAVFLHSWWYLVVSHW